MQTQRVSAILLRGLLIGGRYRHPMWKLGFYIQSNVCGGEYKVIRAIK